MADNRPGGRKRTDGGTGKQVYRRGSGQGTGPVGNGGKGTSRPSGSHGSGSGGGMNRQTRSIGSLAIIAVLAFFLLRGCGGSTSSVAELPEVTPTVTQQAAQNTPSSGQGTEAVSNLASSLLGYNADNKIDVPDLLLQLMGGSYSEGWTGGSSGSSGQGTSGGSSSGQGQPGNTGVLNTSVADGARDKRTVIRGNGEDVVTIMVYMCGADLESQNGMATNDLAEMTKATIGNNVNVIVYTGGAKSWRNSTVSSQTNQIYQVVSGGLKRLESDLGSAAMTDPATLSFFIDYCAKNFPANRFDLIFWDHGGGSVSGYGYDERYASRGSMPLSGINKALGQAGVTFDFIGFDTCLMATMENALMLDRYADYLVASEETEPGCGWYYTNWLTKLSRDTSMPTTEIGQNIVDDFVEFCARYCQGQKATLSVVDLAELAYTSPVKFVDFSNSIIDMLANKEYAAISTARNNTREFAASTKIDQVDLIDMAQRLGNSEGTALAGALMDAIKYNRTSSNMTNAFGLSIYFPYKRISYVDRAVSEYNAIGIDESYCRAIRQFASMESSGQAALGGTGSAVQSLFEMTGGLGGHGSSSGGSSSGNSSSYSSTGTYGNSDLIGQLLGSFLGGDLGSISGLSSADFLSDRALSDEETLQYITDNSFDGNSLIWTKNGDGDYYMYLPEQQWSLVRGLLLNAFLDDGEGYIDLGLDNVFDFDEYGNLLPDTSGYWIAINKQPVAYYFLDQVVNGESSEISGYVPCYLNGNRANLLIVFNDEHPGGCVVGAQSVYKNGETDTVAKNMYELQDGDTIDFLADYYTYDGEFIDSYMIGDQMVIEIPEGMEAADAIEVSDVKVPNGELSLMYRFTDLYNREYWSAQVPLE
ncbi:MAG: peptidase C11 [Lachnospiraceae bacterium]|nr:peptidase C11 [Lachnospiraceae bacterium]